VLLRLFAPFLPFVTEEAWSAWQPGSVHRAAWPDAEPLLALPGDPGVLAVASAAIAAVRKAKSQASVPLRTPARLLTVTGPDGELGRLSSAAADLRAAGHLERIELRPGPGPEAAHEVLL
jgi:valyl-tRNA synthetase